MSKEGRVVEQESPADSRPKDRRDRERKETGAQRRKFGLLELLAVALVATVLGTVGSEYVPHKSDDFRVVIPAQPPLIVQRAPEIVVGVAFFDNGKSRLTVASRAAVLAWAEALKECPQGHFTVRGSASSVPFLPGSPKNNIQLANDRADVVLALLASKGVKGLEPEHVTKESELVSGRRFDDHPGQQRTNSLEAVARRADLKFEDFGGCKLP
jgi:outer membrane protein OmpA-like peptidoglycan-associated protein